GPDVDALDIQGQAVPVGKSPAKRFISLGSCAKPVVEMRQACDNELTVFSQVEQQAGQRHRVRASGQADKDPRPRWQERVAPNRPPNLLVKRRCKVGSPFALRATARQFSISLPSRSSRAVRRERRLVPEGGLEPPTPRL